MYTIRHEMGRYVQQELPPCCLFLSKFSWLLCFLVGKVTLHGRIKNQVEKGFFFTARSRMLVFIDERGFFYCLASNNTLCWWCVIFIARTPVCTVRKERIWPEVATIVHSLIGQNEPCSLPMDCHSTQLYLKATRHKSKMQRITLKKTFNMWSFFCCFFFSLVCFSSLTQLWLCYIVYKHEKERNALKLMHISLHLKESCVNGCIDEVLWGLKALHRV